MMLSDEEVNEAVGVAVTTWVSEMSAAGFKTVTNVNKREDGWALEQSLAIFLDTLATDFYAKQSVNLFQEGVRDPELNRVLTEDVQRINVEILRKLLSLGFRVEKLLDLCENGQSLSR